MKSLLLKIIFLLIFFLITISAQEIKKETINNNIYFLDVALNPYPYKILIKNSLSILHFENYLDESKPGTPVLPSKDLFIAIPPGTSPIVEVLVTQDKKINAEPELNPNVQRVNDSTVSYTGAVTPVLSNRNQLFKVNGFLWVGNNYCIHLTVYQYQYNYQTREILENTEIRIKLTFETPLKTLSKKAETVSSNILNTEFASVYQSNPTYTIPVADDWINYSQTYIKIGVARDGIYRIYYNDLLTLGVPINQINPKTFNLFNKGKAIPVFVQGENDGVFDSGDFIEFAGIRNMGGNYREISNPGEPYKEYLGRYTDTTVYWLTWGSENGVRVSISNGNPALTPLDTLKYYTALIHKEINNWFDFSMADQVEREMPYWAENKTWNEGNLGVGTYSAVFNLSDIYPNAEAKMFVKLQDYASNIFSNAHLLALSLNNYPTLYDSGYINKYDQKVLNGSFNSSLLVPGTNSVKVHSYQTTATLNACIKDWYEIEYPRYIKTINDSLSFTFNYLAGTDVYCFNITNIQNEPITIWKYGNSFKKYSVTVVSGSAFIKDTLDAYNKFTVLDSSKVLKPKIYYKKQFVNLRGTDNKADYIIITGKPLLNKSTEYKNFIALNYNVDAKLIDVDDIYDEFAYGYFNPESIQTFLKNTHTNWQQPFPKYIFIIGDANYDYHLNKFVYQKTPPVANIVPSFGAPVSDNWFVNWDTTGAYIPQMNIGRIPVTNEQELENYLLRHQAYLNKPYNDWNKRFLFFSAGKEDESELLVLRQTNQAIIDNYVNPAPIGGNSIHFYKTINPVTNFGPYSQDYIKNAIDNGAVFISYLGHSGTQTWDNSISDPLQLNNNYNYSPLITDFGCSTGKFAEPDVVSFSELFINQSNGQAISYIGNSSLGFTSTAISFPKIFYKKLLIDSVLNLSEAHKLAKLELLQTYGSTGVYRLFALTNELIGDPIISLPIPQKPNLVLQDGEINIESNNLNDLSEKAVIRIKYFNWGKVLSDSILITVRDVYNGENVFIDSVYKQIPNYKDSIDVFIPILNKAGEHNLSIFLDEDNKIDEINESDNFLNYKFYIVSSRLRTLLQYDLENGLTDSLLIINPSVKALSDSIEIELSNNEDFIGSSYITKKMDTVVTSIQLPIEYLNNRIWIRGKIKNDNSFGFNKSVFTGINSDYFLNDTLSFNTANFQNVTLHNNLITLDSNKITFHVISAGFNDGNTAIILKNGENYIPETTLRGHHICVFKDSTYEFVTYKLFDLLGGGTTAANNYLNFLDSLQENEIVIFAINDEGYSGLTSALKSKIKEFGSKYIDSLVFRGSWAFIGRLGAFAGSMPEAYSKPFDGRVEVDTVIQKLFKIGSLTTSKIGPSSKWETVSLNQILPQSTEINLKAIAYKKDESIDTLNTLSVQNGAADLNTIDASIYPYIKLLLNLKTDDENYVPSILSVAVNYKGLAELATNYQVVSVEKDSIPAGGSNNLRFSIYNIGFTDADSFIVKVDVENGDRTYTKLFDELISKLTPGDKQEFNVNYQATVFDNDKKFVINIDPENRVNEYYKDNNYFVKSFYVEPDLIKPTIRITFNDNEILNGDFVSATPDIKISINDESLLPVIDTTAMEIFLNDIPIYYSSNSGTISYSINNSNPKYVVNFKPNLEDGNYTLRVVAKDPGGNIADSASSVVNFVVSNETKLMEVYNYPNPFADGTYFTFKLTQIPDEIKIRIYTIAGRLIKEIVKKWTELNYDFNKIYWDGKDQDDDVIANGTYLYKVILKHGSKTETATQKLVIMR